MRSTSFTILLLVAGAAVACRTGRTAPPTVPPPPAVAAVPDAIAVTTPPPSSASPSSELPVGSYGMPGAVGPTQLLEIAPGGRYSLTYNGQCLPGDTTATGSVTLDGQTLRFRPASGTGGPMGASMLQVRTHDGRRVLLNDESLAAFEILPSIRLGLVQLRTGETPSSVMLPSNDSNPLSPDNAQPLPGTLDLVAEDPDPPHGRFHHIRLVSAPYNVSFSGCILPGGRGECEGQRTEATLGVGAWAQLVRHWWSFIRPGVRCEPPGRRPGAPRYTLVWAPRVQAQGSLPDDRSPAVLDQPCEAEARLVWWIIQHVPGRRL